MRVSAISAARGVHNPDTLFNRITVTHFSLPRFGEPDRLKSERISLLRFEEPACHDDTTLTQQLPCLECCEPEAEAARREIAGVYLDARAGKLPTLKLRGGPLPWCCCRRPREPQQIDVAAMIANARRS